MKNGWSMKKGSVVARQPVSLQVKREGGWSINTVKERLFGVAFLGLFDVALLLK
jgi:hypothetical protein